MKKDKNCIKKPREQCYNCKFSGTHFRIVGMTEMFCNHPDNHVLVEQGAHPFDFVRNWNNTCDKWHKKEKDEKN